MADFTNKPMTYWVPLEASGPTGYEFVKKKLKLRIFLLTKCLKNRFFENGFSL